MLAFINFLFCIIVGTLALGAIAASTLIVYVVYALIRGDD